MRAELCGECLTGRVKGARLLLDIEADDEAATGNLLSAAVDVGMRMPITLTVAEIRS